jgi:hypothetical protein
MPYFAWIDPGETTFTAGHMRWDEQIFSFTLQQDEGDPASLTIVVRRPRNVAGDPIGLLGPGRKIWCWFALDCGADLIRFRGRLVGVPTSLFEELVTLEFVARPIDLVMQKAALADSLRVLPYYDEAVIDPSRRTDPEVVLEGYTKIWHYDRETHVLSVSDEITGEDGLVEFDSTSEANKVLYDGLSLSLTSGPLARVDVDAEYTWTQQAFGNVDLTRYIIDNWPNEPSANRGEITSFTFGADSWPKNGAGLGDGWTVIEATASNPYDTTVRTETGNSDVTVKWWDGGSTHVTSSYSIGKIGRIPPDSIQYGPIITSDSTTVTYAPDGEGGTYTASFSHSDTTVTSILPMHSFAPTLLAGFKASRQYIEAVAFSLFADVQSILTDPEDGEALQISDVTSVNLSEPLSDGSIPIGDPRRNCYIATDRGNRSLEHLIALARAHLMKRARVVEISFAPKLIRMSEITLRKNASLIEPRVGQALGKIIGYSVALNGNDGRIDCQVRIGCTIGRGGSQVETAGTPTYCTIDYAGFDYQQFNDRVIMFDPIDSSVGYQPPNAAANDDGVNFLAAIRAEDVIDIPLAVENPPAQQRLRLQAPMTFPAGEALQFEAGTAAGALEEAQAMVNARKEAVTNALKEVETRATFRLKSMTAGFSTSYAIAVTDLKIPTGYDLEAT